jgi:hypothetical protein
MRADLGAQKVGADEMTSPAPTEAPPAMLIATRIRTAWHGFCIAW